MSMRKCNEREQAKFQKQLAFRAQGPGWQSRMNEALRKAAGV